LPDVLDSLFKQFEQADRGFILLRDDEAQQLVPRLVRTRRPREATPPRYSNRIVGQCLEKGQAILSKDAFFDPSFGDGAGSSILEARIRSVMVVPLLARESGAPFGVFQLDTQDQKKKFTQDDLELFAAVASQVAIAVENARLAQQKTLHDQKDREMALAREMQISILPERMPVVAGYEFFAHYASALEVGGDYYDFIPLPDGRLAVTIADVVGKGMSAALLMAKLSSDARFCLLSEKDPAAAVARLNELLLPTCHHTDRFITLAVALLDPAAQTVTLVNAGHVTPAAYRAAGGTLEDAHHKEAAGLPVGIEARAAYPASQTVLRPGDSLILFTDGVVEARDKAGAQFRVEGMHAALRGGPFGPQCLGERLVAAVKQHSHGCKQQDDITVVSFGKL
jgi:serine phosphatase RsbU (regulator of sigma subunit)